MNNIAPSSAARLRLVDPALLRVAEAIEAGIGVNEGLISTEMAPFGGVKASALAEKARSTASRTAWRSSTSAWAGSTRHERASGQGPPCRLHPLH